jgi:hypothetical protein
MLKLSFTLPIQFRIEWGKNVPGKLVPLPGWGRGVSEEQANRAEK